jgi:hypothetical protein
MGEWPTVAGTTLPHPRAGVVTDFVFTQRGRVSATPGCWPLNRVARARWWRARPHASQLRHTWASELTNAGCACKR